MTDPATICGRCNATNLGLGEKCNQCGGVYKYILDKDDGDRVGLVALSGIVMLAAVIVWGVLIIGGITIVGWVL